MDMYNIIKSIDFFKILDEKQIELLANISMIRSFSKDTIVYYESDIDYSLQFLLDGTVKIYKVDKHNNEIFLYYIYENNMISELTSIDTESIYCFSNASSFIAICVAVVTILASLNTTPVYASIFNINSV